MKGKQLQLPLYLIASILFGLKTYIVYVFVFKLSIENGLQAIILLINPFVSAFVFYGISVWLKDKNQRRFICYGTLVGSIILWANVMFYRDFTDFITIPILFQASNAVDVGNSAVSLVSLSDLVLFIDVIIIWYISSKYKDRITTHYARKNKLLVVSLSIVLLLGNYLLAELERPQLFQSTYDREYLVKNIGVYNFHLYDIVQQSFTTSQRAFADGTKIPRIKEYVNANVKSDEESELFGIAKDKNLIFVSLESFQSFVIDNTLNGEEVTPFLNELKDNSYYFENFYHQTAQGKTSDSEFLIENSLYPLPGGAVFFVRGENEYDAMPEILGEQGYYSAVFHANDSRFWNRNVMYDSLGYDNFYDESAYEVTEQNTVGWGLKDKEFFDQSIKYLQSMSQPFYSKFITLTNHHPFELSAEEASIQKFNSESETVNNYFQTVRYTDEAIKQFFDELKQAGLYENSIIVLMGDHYGISAYENEALGEYLDKELTDYDTVQLQRVPFFIHIPGEDGKVMSKIAGQIDVKPTLLHLLGVDTKGDINFGTDLFSDDRKEFIALRDGSFVSDEYVYTKESCYDRDTGELMEVDLGLDKLSACGPIEEKVLKELNYSDEVVYGNLLRFNE
ncbi:LTA synthase family protein [Radiobacillus sp. PE A8.2]|uniref:LTA synthase family protein n=1 Tax=Radiobacillus sp. PE A8.2 TaxID=3380349 RepID=UPI00388DC104